MSFFISDCELARTHLESSAYYRALCRTENDEERRRKYPTGLFTCRTIDPTGFNVLPGIEGIGALAINIVRVPDALELGASWTCQNTIFLNTSGDVRHECVHILQRMFPNVFDALYRWQGFIHSDFGETMRLRHMHKGILNPDTFYPDRPDYAYHDPVTGNILVCSYDDMLNTIVVDRMTGCRVVHPPKIVFMGRWSPLDHPHEMMAEAVAHTGSFPRVRCIIDKHVNGDPIMSIIVVPRRPVGAIVVGILMGILLTGILYGIHKQIVKF